MSETLVHSAKLKNGVEYELHVVEGFSERAEIALLINKEIVSVITIDTKRTGNIVCTPGKSRVLLIKRSNKEGEEEEPDIPDVSDVIGSDENETAEPEDLNNQT